MQFKTNTIGITHTLNAFLPLIMAGPTKKIIVVTTQMGSPHYALEAKNTFALYYAVSKAALNMVIVKFAAEQKYREGGLRTVAISLGVMRTATEFRKFALPPHHYICLYHVCLFSILYPCSARANK